MLSHFPRTSYPWGDYSKFLGNPQYQPAMNSLCQGIGSYAGYFDPALSWFKGKAYAYKDAYAIYTPPSRNSATVNAHPEWILKDQHGNPLYIPWGTPGEYDQYAADVGNPMFCQSWIGEAVQMLTAAPHGYRGLWVDDVNPDLSRVTDIQGNPAVPTNPASGKPYDSSAWFSAWMAFLQHIRNVTKVFGLEVVHNPVWYGPAYNWALADWINVERGFSDQGITGGTGQWSFEAYTNYMTAVQKTGAKVLLDEITYENMPYKVAAALLVGADGTGFEDATPDLYTPQFQQLVTVEMGQPLSPAQRFSGVYQRSFEKGLVYVVEPGGDSITLTLDQPMLDVYQNKQVSAVTLAGSQGVVLTR
jgi:hypothetical protein